MNLKDQQGFVTLGYDSPAEAQAEPSPADTGADNLADKAAAAATEPEDDDKSPSAEAEKSESNKKAVFSWSSRADSMDMDLSDEEALLSLSRFEHSGAWQPQGSEQSINELHDYFSHFYSIRRIVKQVHHEFKMACQEIQELLRLSTSGDAAGAEKSTEAWLSASEDQTIMSLLRTDPVFIVLGCKGSGKSSVINGILGEEILPSSSAMLKYACNGIVHLQYDEVGYVKIARSATQRRLDDRRQQQQEDDQDQPQQPPRPAAVVRAFIEEDMTDAERQAWAALDNCVLEVGVRNPILRTRVQFLEIPGDCFDPRLRERLIRQLLLRNHQTVLYVIDGNKGLGNSDREFLFFLKANMPNMRIFFIINKVDYDPEAEEMDCESDVEEAAGEGDDEEPDGQRYHESGVQTQKRKQKLAVDQLEKYKLASGGSGKRSVFPVSVLRQKLPLEGKSEQIQQLNQEYRSQYQVMVAALKDCLVDTGRSRMELALSTLFLVTVRTFDAFTRDPGSADQAGEGARQAAEQASKELITQSFRQTKEKFKECKAIFLDELVEIHRRSEEAILRACRELEFGPLRLYSRIRNNEVEQQYREQINNYVLHLLNIEIKESLERKINELKAMLFEEVEKLKQMFLDASKERPASPWEDLIRTHADEIVMGIVRLNFSVEWKSEASFLKWVKKLWSSATVNKAKTISPNTPEWKSEVAKEFYSSIDLSTVVRKMFAGVDCTLKQAESGLLNLAHSRHKFAAKLQKLLAREDEKAMSVWLRVQFCLVSAEALRNLQAHGALASSTLTEPVAATCLGRLCHLTRGYANFEETKKSGVAVTVTKIGTDASAPDAVAKWVDGLGGIPNHHLVKGQLVRTQRSVAISLMVTFTDKYELCVLHSAYCCSLKERIEGRVVAKYNKVQGFIMLKDLLHIWRLFGQEKELLPWSLRLGNLKASTTEGATVVYDYLESPLPTLKKGHIISSLFAKSPAEVRADKQVQELNNLLQLTFMILVRDPREFQAEVLTRIEESEEQPEEKNKLLKKHLLSLTAGSASSREMDRIPADTIANLWYTKADHKVRDIEEWIDRSLQRAVKEQQQQQQK